jgi:hypothetical protein
MLPAYPWDQRPDNYPLTADEVCEALFQAEGDITAASLRLKVGSLILRKFVERSSRARATIRECDNRLGDKARSKLAQALDDGDARRQDWAIRYILNARTNRHLGYAAHDDVDPSRSLSNNQPLVNINLPPVQWADGSPIGPPSQLQTIPKNVIELHPSSLEKAPAPSPKPSSDGSSE